MNYKIFGLVSVALLVGPMMANAQVTTLDYQGNVFTNVNVSGNGSFPDTPTLFSLVGNVVLSSPLSTNLNDATLVPASWSFNPPLLNSDLFTAGCCASAAFEFTTNNVGTITAWNVDLSFAFVGTNSPSGNSVVIGTSGDSYAAFGSTPTGCGPPGGCSLDIKENNTTPGVWTVTQRAPEIDPASAASGLTLLLGGLAVLHGRRKLEATGQ